MPRITRPTSEDGILKLMDSINPTAPHGYHERMFNRLLVAGYFGNNGAVQLYLPNQQKQEQINRTRV